VALHACDISGSLASVGRVEVGPTGSIALRVIIEMAQHDQFFVRVMLVATQRCDFIVDPKDSFFSSSHDSPM